MLQKGNLQRSYEWHQLAEPRSPWCQTSIPRAQHLHRELQAQVTAGNQGAWEAGAQVRDPGHFLIDR